MSAGLFSDTLDRVKPSVRSCLIVDDSDAFCAAARRLLEAGGIDVVGTALALDEAVEIALATRPELVLVDIDLGAWSGFDVVEALHTSMPQPLPAIVLVSTHDEDDVADMVESSSALGFIPKFELSIASIDAVLINSQRFNSRRPGT